MIDFPDPHDIGRSLVYALRRALGDRIAKYSDEVLVSFWAVFSNKFQSNNPEQFLLYLEKVKPPTVEKQG